MFFLLNLHLEFLMRVKVISHTVSGTENLSRLIKYSTKILTSSEYSLFFRVSLMDLNFVLTHEKICIHG